MAYPPPPPSQPEGQPAGQPYPQYQPYPQQAYGAPPPVTGPLRGRTLRRLGWIFLVVGFALAIVGGVVYQTQSLDKVDSFSRVPISTTSQGTAHFSKAGGYVAYYEAPGADTRTKNIPIPDIVLTSPSGTQMPLETLYGGGRKADLTLNAVLTYSHNGHDGIAVYQFHISEPGTYGVQFPAIGGAAPGSDMAFGPSIGKGTAIGAALLVPGVLLIIAAIVLLIIGFVKRRNDKRARAAFAGGPPPGYGYPPPGYPPPPGQGYPPPPGTTPPPGYPPSPWQQDS